MSRFLKALIAVVILAASPLCVLAQGSNPGSSQTETPYAVETEAMKLGGAKAKLFETGSSAGDRSMIVKTFKSGSQIFGKTKVKLTNEFRFFKGESEVLLSGKCVIRMEGTSMFGIDYSQNKARAYACAFENQDSANYAMEVAVPAFAETRIGGGMFSMTMSNDLDEATRAILKAKLIYKGVAYEAKPTGFNTNTMFSRRVVEGYVVMRDGKPIGKLAYRKTGVTTSNNQADLIIPKNDDDDREAVLFMIMTLNAMPDVYSDVQREELSWK